MVATVLQLVQLCIQQCLLTRKIKIRRQIVVPIDVERNVNSARVTAAVIYNFRNIYCCSGHRITVNLLLTMQHKSQLICRVGEGIQGPLTSQPKTGTVILKHIIQYSICMLYSVQYYCIVYMYSTGFLIYMHQGGLIYAFFKQINLSVQASSRSKNHAQFFFFWGGTQISFSIQPLLYLNFDLKEKKLKI